MQPFLQQKLQLQLAAYRKALESYHISDRNLTINRPVKWSDYIMLIAGLPLFCFGYLLTALPVVVAKRIVDKKVYRIDFYAWIFLATAAVMSVIWLVALVAGFAIISIKYAICVLLAAVCSGVFALYYQQFWHKFHRTHQTAMFIKLNPELSEQLQDWRESIIAMFSSMRQSEPAKIS